MPATHALRFKTFRSAVNGFGIFRQQPALKIGFILIFVLLCEASLWNLFYEGFRFLNGREAAGTFLIRRMFGLFFMGLSAMLVLSSAVTSYAALFRSQDVTFLLTRPVTPAQIAVHKFFETSRLSSWAFFFVVIPFVGAYAYFQKDSMLVLGWTVLYSIPLLMISCGLGTLLTLICVRWAPARRDVWAIVLFCVTALAIVGWMLNASAPEEDESVFSLVNRIPGMRLASHPLLPSAWVSEGMNYATRMQWGSAFRHLILLTVNGLFVVTLIDWVGEAWFYRGWIKVSGASANTRRAPRLLPILDRKWPGLAPQATAIVSKDIRSFLRDPMQWSQALIFFGLLALYFANLRNLNYHEQNIHWRNAIAFLNVFSMSAVMCSLGARFLYPQLSLEGHSFWILGLSPAKRRTILMTKFWFSALALLLISLALTLLSTGMLAVSGTIRLIAVVLSVCTSIAIAGLSTGLGAIFLDLRESNPAAILSGFGGTLNLILSLAYMIGASLPFCIVYHLFVMRRLDASQCITYFILCAVWLLLLTLAATVAPLAIGRRSLETRDF